MSADAGVVARFLREAQASARLRSDHVCRVFDVGRLGDGAPYLVMELLDGSDLAQRIPDGALPVATAVDHVLLACVAIAGAAITALLLVRPAARRRRGIPARRSRPTR
jgi:serine/threonine-protein kinase